jgi:hypothetical protein
VIEMRVLLVTMMLMMLAPVTVATQGGKNDEEGAWTVSASAAFYALPDEGDYVQPTVSVDRDALHLEARYNYEAQRTASLWAGWAIRGGERIEWELIPMVGAVFGETDGIAPGSVVSIAWGKVDLYAESEYVHTRSRDDRFVYHWSEVAIAPLRWLRAGLVTQRTRAYVSDRKIQRGPFVNVLVGRLDAATYLFIAPDSRPTAVLSLGWSF